MLFFKVNHLGEVASNLNSDISEYMKLRQVTIRSNWFSKKKKKKLGEIKFKFKTFPSSLFHTLPKQLRELLKKIDLGLEEVRYYEQLVTT